MPACLVMSNSPQPLDCSPPGSSVHGVFQARILEWVAISFSRGSSRPREWTSVSYVFCILGRFFIHWAIRKCLTLCDPHGLYGPWNSPGQNTEVDSHSLLQGIFQELNWGLLAGRFFTSWATREAHTICIPEENGGTVKEFNWEQFNKGTVYRISN